MRPRQARLPTLVALVLLVSVAAGIAASHVVSARRSPLDVAREQARSGHRAEAERLYLDLARGRPMSLPLVIELIDNHQRLVATLARFLSGDDPDTLSLEARIAERPIDELLMAPDVPPDVALLAPWWRKVARGQGDDADRAAIVETADAPAPIPWANHLLGREAQRGDRDPEAAERFAREATVFEGRRDDAEAACRLWIDGDAWDRLDTALEQPRFAGQVPADVRLQEAIHRKSWMHAVRWFFPSQYEDTTLAIVVLALVSALVWFIICALIGLVRERPRARLPLYLTAFALGVASTYVTIAIAMVEEHVLNLGEKGNPILDAIYFVVGVGLREELSKALLFLPLVPILLRWGRRREALACGALVGLGFAAEENLGYLHMGLSTALARFLTANFMHMSTTGLVAVAIDDYARGREEKEGGLSRALAFAVVIHGFYDFFLSSASIDRSSFMSMFVFVILTRRFVGVLRRLPGREEPLARWFCVGLAVVAGASFIYASVLVGPRLAATSLFEGMLGVAIVAYMFIYEFGNV